MEQWNEQQSGVLVVVANVHQRAHSYIYIHPPDSHVHFKKVRYIHPFIIFLIFTTQILKLHVCQAEVLQWHT